MSDENKSIHDFDFKWIRLLYPEKALHLRIPYLETEWIKNANPQI